MVGMGGRSWGEKDKELDVRIDVDSLEFDHAPIEKERKKKN